MDRAQLASIRSRHEECFLEVPKADMTTLLAYIAALEAVQDAAQDLSHALEESLREKTWLMAITDLTVEFDRLNTALAAISEED